MAFPLHSPKKNWTVPMPACRVHSSPLRHLDTELPSSSEAFANGDGEALETTVSVEAWGLTKEKMLIWEISCIRRLLKIKCQPKS